MDDKLLQEKLDALLANDHKHDMHDISSTEQLNQINKAIEKLETKVETCVTNTEFSPFKNGIFAGIGIVMTAVIGAVLTLVIKK